MAPATVDIEDAQDLELDGGSQNSMTLAEVAIPAPVSGMASTIVGFYDSSGRDRGEEEIVIIAPPLHLLHSFRIFHPPPPRIRVLTQCVHHLRIR